MADKNSGAGGDTLEFLKIMGVEAAASSNGEGGRASRQEASRPAAVALPEITFSDQPPVSTLAAAEPTAVAPAPAGTAACPSADAEPKPVVIKGGPRRVVRADGKWPAMSAAAGQRRFSLSSGHALFTPRREVNPVRSALIAGMALLLVAAVFVAVWFATKASITQDQQQDVVGTSSYDGSLSLTPADDGGYYTVFLVTSTETDEERVGDLAQILMVRTDKGVTVANRVYVPVNLYVKPSGTGETATPARTVKDVLATQSIPKTLRAIDDAFGTRLYNVVCCSQETFDKLQAVMEGGASPASIDPSSLLGAVRSNLTLDQIVSYCGKVGAIDQLSIDSYTAPTTDIDVNGTVMAQGSPASYRIAVIMGETMPGNAQIDSNGHFAGTQYDEAGNPLLDADGIPVGALRDPETQQLVFDENGYLQFYGQQYDERGNPVGTQYDEAGNILLDGWGNPQGTRYDENGSVVYDWRGNMVVDPV